MLTTPRTQDSMASIITIVIVWQLVWVIHSSLLEATFEVGPLDPVGITGSGSEFFFSLTSNGKYFINDLSRANQCCSSVCVHC